MKKASEKQKVLAIQLAGIFGGIFTAALIANGRFLEALLPLAMAIVVIVLGSDYPKLRMAIAQMLVGMTIAGGLACGLRAWIGVSNLVDLALIFLMAGFGWLTTKAALAEMRRVGGIRQKDAKG